MSDRVRGEISYGTPALREWIGKVTGDTRVLVTMAAVELLVWATVEVCHSEFFNCAGVCRCPTGLSLDWLMVKVYKATSRYGNV